MSRLIKPDASSIENMVANYKRMLMGCRCGVYAATPRYANSKYKFATVTIEALAWAKMQILIDAHDHEIAWHGVAHRVGEASYVISDVVVYPQIVTGATVEMDEVEYGKWLVKNVGDERFAHLFSQFHSHVNFSPTPSATDDKHRHDIVDMLADDGFYLFAIYNKNYECSWRVYDKALNTLFVDDDVAVVIESYEDAFLDEVNEVVSVVSDVNQVEDIAKQLHNTDMYDDYLGYNYFNNAII